MANTTKYMDKKIHNDNLKNDRILKIDKQVFTCQTLHEHYGNPKVKKMAIQVKWKILEPVIFPTLLFNVENWTNISIMEMEKMEQMYKKII